MKPYFQKWLAITLALIALVVVVERATANVEVKEDDVVCSATGQTIEVTGWSDQANQPHTWYVDGQPYQPAVFVGDTSKLTLPANTYATATLRSVWGYADTADLKTCVVPTPPEVSKPPVVAPPPGDSTTKNPPRAIVPPAKVTVSKRGPKRVRNGTKRIIKWRIILKNTTNRKVVFNIRDTLPKGFVFARKPPKRVGLKPKQRKVIGIKTWLLNPVTNGRKCNKVRIYGPRIRNRTAKFCTRVYGKPPRPRDTGVTG